MSEYNNIADLHKEVWDFLLEKRNEYPDLYFTLRTNNPDDRLGKGYLFNGNDESLYFSFWKGIDRSNHTPNISISIKNDGTLFIWLNARDSEKKATFFEKLAIALGKFTQTKNFKTNGVEKTWRRSYAQDGWRNGLEDFINNDWKKINQFLLFSSDTEDLKSISREDFEASLRKQNDIREFISSIIPIVAEPTYFPIKLQEIYLKNIGHFEEITISLDKRVTLLIGENGSGKSTILRALALGLVGTDGFSSQDIILLGKDFFSSWLRILDYEKELNPIYSPSGIISLSYTKGIKIYENKIEFNFNPHVGVIPSNILEEGLDSFASVNENQNEMLFLGFPQGGGHQAPMPLTDDNAPQFIDLLPIITDEAHQKLERLGNFLVVSYNTYNKALANGNEAEAKNHLAKIDLVFKLISLIISDNENENKIKFLEAAEKYHGKNKKNLILVEIDKQKITLDLVSQGFQNLFYWIGELVSRSYQVNEYYQTNQPKKNKEDIFEMDGIVLIDEIDTYLHPNWQYNILKVLTETFKNLQFLVTSHSPAVLTSLNPKEIDFSIFDLRTQKTKNQREYNVYGSRLDLMYPYMNGSDRLKQVRKDFTHLREIVDKAETIEHLENVEQEISRMKSTYDAHDPEILYAVQMFLTKKLFLEDDTN